MIEFREKIDSHINVIENLAQMEAQIAQAGTLLSQAVCRGGKILVCGNGGSAADAQHFAAELIGRFQKERPPIQAIALTTDTSVLTALANDYGQEAIFARQVEGIGCSGDILLGISTSGKSVNVEKAALVAREKNIHTIGLLGKDGGSLARIVDLPLVVPSQETPLIQEAHFFLLHHLAGVIEENCQEDR